MPTRAAVSIYFIWTFGSWGVSHPGSLPICWASREEAASSPLPGSLPSVSVNKLGLDGWHSWTPSLPSLYDPAMAPTKTFTPVFVLPTTLFSCLALANLFFFVLIPRPEPCEQYCEDCYTARPPAPCALLLDLTRNRMACPTLNSSPCSSRPLFTPSRRLTNHPIADVALTATTGGNVAATIFLMLPYQARQVAINMRGQI